ncbi:MAG: queuosine salvage family protein [Myxococcota bacterium]
MSDFFAEIRTACARVRERARHVRVDADAFARWIDEEAVAPPTPSQDPAHRAFPDADTTLAYVITMDAINFGSGWFPHLRKRPGKSGYLSLSARLYEHFEAAGAWSAADLRTLDVARCNRIFEQEGVAEVQPLMELFARALHDLGSWLETHHAGSFRRAVEAAGGRASTLAADLAQMPFYRDVASYDDFAVPLYKRAQITASDLAAAFEGKGLGAFDDLDALTIFADNLVPHVLRCSGVLVYDEALASRIAAEEQLEVGSPEEVEIRAVALDVVESAVAELRARGVTLTAQQLDTALWNRGQRPEIKAHPRHRARSYYY